MKKKLFVLSILSLVFVALMFILMFIPMGSSSTTDNETYSIFGAATFNFLAFSFLNAGLRLYPIVALVFAIFIVIRSIKNFKISKSEEEPTQTKYSIKCLWILFIIAFYGWVAAFLDLGQGEGDMVGIIKATIFFLVPVIAIMVVNGKLKKLEIKKEEVK